MSAAAPPDPQETAQQAPATPTHSRQTVRTVAAITGTRPPNPRYRRPEATRDVLLQVRDIRPKFPQDYRDPGYVLLRVGADPLGRRSGGSYRYRLTRARGPLRVYLVIAIR